ncbi:hypothetical protein [Azotosporobacter soli]|uniref:hypothetical protein n=1 Tax=Azotosporobacter soli TaxID=3055040 RepID=UPI0031FE7A93
MASSEEMKFNKFLVLVKEQAGKQGKCFFLDDSEGNEADLGELLVQNLSGWLIDEADKAEFEANWKTGDDPGERFDDQYIYVVWQQNANGTVTVQFCESL